MTNWKVKLAAMGVSTTALVLAVLGLVALVGECHSFRNVGTSTQVPTVSPPTRAEERAPVKVLPGRDVQAIAPKPRELEKLAAKYHRPDLDRPIKPVDLVKLPVQPARLFSESEHSNMLNKSSEGAEILGERTLPKLPDGGTALLTLEPDGRVEVTVAPNPPKLFEWSSTYELGGLYGIGQGGDTRARGWAAVEPLRFARLHLRVEAGVDLRAGTSGAYAMAGVVWRSR